MYNRLVGMIGIAVIALWLVLMTLTNNCRYASVQKERVDGDKLQRCMLLHGGGPL
jgi:hypothetical protein